VEATSPDGPTPALALFRAITAHQVSSAIHVAARLKLADHMVGDDRDHRELADVTGTDPDGLLRLLRMLASASVLAETRPGRFALTPVGRYLRSDVDDSLFAMAMTMASPHGQERYHELEDSVRTGRSQVEEKGSAVFHEAPPAVIAMLTQAMSFFARYTVGAICSAVDFGRFRTLVDLGAGAGMTLSEILATQPELRGVLVEQQYMIPAATDHMKQADLIDRCEIVEGDFFRSVPAGGDAYLLKHILHDWNDTDCGRILGRCREAMAPGATLVVVESVLPDQIDDSPAAQLIACSDVMMLLNSPSGRERTEAQFRALLDAAGFVVTAVTAVRPAWTGVESTSVLEAVRR
jgi:hypothetical protein